MVNYRKKNLRHIEVDGCIVNIRTGLMDMDGHTVTSVQILADNDGGDKWTIDGKPGWYSINVRVVKE